MYRELSQGDRALMRVLHYLGNVGMTGVETFLLTLCEEQKRRGFEPHITCDLEGRQELSRVAAAIGVTVHAFPTPDGFQLALPRKLGSARLRGRRVLALAHLLRDRSFDVLHVHAVGIAGLEAFLAARRAKTLGLVVTHHATLGWFLPYRSRMSDFTFWLERRYAKRVVLPYEAASREMIEGGVHPERAAVVPFCADARKFLVSHAAPKMVREFRLLMAARLVPGKGHGELLDAIARVRVRVPHLRASIAGDGPTRPEIEAKMRELALGDVVEMLGHVRVEDMPMHMRLADVIVLPTYMSAETFPVCLLEGMAMGLPAIGTRWFGIPDIIEDGVTGLVIEPRDVDALAVAIERLATDPAMCAEAGRRARARFQQRFTSEAVARAYEDVYAGALAAPA